MLFILCIVFYWYVFLCRFHCHFHLACGVKHKLKSTRICVLCFSFSPIFLQKIWYHISFSWWSLLSCCFYCSFFSIQSSKMIMMQVDFSLGPDEADSPDIAQVRYCFVALECYIKKFLTTFFYRSSILDCILLALLYRWTYLDIPNSVEM